jgi:hypothetical protein
MTAKETLKEIVDYLQIELSDYDKKRLYDILNENHTIVSKTVYKDKPMYVVQKPVNLIHELKLSCELYGVELKSVIGHGKSGNFKTDNAKVHFCRKVKICDPRVKTVQLAHILQKDHSTICHYWYDSKADVPYSPLPKPIRKKWAKLETH